MAAGDRADVSDSITATARRQFHCRNGTLDRFLADVEQSRRYSTRHDGVLGQIVELFDRTHSESPFEAKSGHYWTEMFSAYRERKMGTLIDP
jgi:hypothetical protein